MRRSLLLLASFGLSMGLPTTPTSDKSCLFGICHEEDLIFEQFMPSGTIGHPAAKESLLIDKEADGEYYKNGIKYDIDTDGETAIVQNGDKVTVDSDFNSEVDSNNHGEDMVYEHRGHTEVTVLPGKRSSPVDPSKQIEQIHAVLPHAPSSNPTDTNPGGLGYINFEYDYKSGVGGSSDDVVKVEGDTDIVSKNGTTTTSEEITADVKTGGVKWDIKHIGHTTNTTGKNLDLVRRAPGAKDFFSIAHVSEVVIDGFTRLESDFQKLNDSIMTSAVEQMSDNFFPGWNTRVVELSQELKRYYGPLRGNITGILADKHVGTDSSQQADQEDESRRLRKVWEDLQEEVIETLALYRVKQVQIDLYDLYATKLVNDGQALWDLYHGFVDVTCMDPVDCFLNYRGFWMGGKSGGSSLISRG